MICSHCQRELRDDSTFCSGCGLRVAHAATAASRASTADRSDGQPARRLARSRTERTLGGVCGGLADYLQVAPVIVRAAWIILSIVPGMVLGGVVLYLLAWLVIPDAPATDQLAAPVLPRSIQLRRSDTNRRIGGVCGGLAEHLNVDATPLRLLWVILSFVPGAVLGGVAVYVFAWLVIPGRPGSESRPVARAV